MLCWPTSPHCDGGKAGSGQLHPTAGRSPSCSPCDPIRQRAVHHLCAISMPYLPHTYSSQPTEAPHSMPRSSRPKKRKQPRRQRSCSPYVLSENDGKRGDPATVRSIDDPVPIRPTAPIGSLTSGTWVRGGKQIPSPRKSRLRLPTEHTPSRSSCSSIRQRAVHHLCAISIPYLCHLSAKTSTDETKDLPHIVQKVFSVLASIYCPGPLPAKYRRHE